jgi:hypothetical protein
MGASASLLGHFFGRQDGFPPSTHTLCPEQGQKEGMTAMADRGSPEWGTRPEAPPDAFHSPTIARVDSHHQMR